MVCRSSPEVRRDSARMMPMAVRENVKAETAAFVTFSPFRSWLGRQKERLVFALAPGAEVEVRKREFLHYAYFISLSPRRLRRLGIAKKAPLRHGGFLFLSAFNGDAESYFRGFSEKLSAQMNDLWGTSVGFRDFAKYEHLDEFIKTYRRRVNFYTTSYRDSSKRVRAALRLQSRLDRLLSAARSPVLDDASFAEAYERTVQAVWGNGEPPSEGAAR
jgi:hypothetical protein